MTTNVKVEAHPSEGTETRLRVWNQREGTYMKDVKLKEGESDEAVCSEGVIVTICEEPDLEYLAAKKKEAEEAAKKKAAEDAAKQEGQTEVITTGAVGEIKL